MSVIELAGIDKAYGGKTVFSQFHLAVEKGEYLVVSGKSGAGKTTLLNIIGLLEKPDRGDVTILGVKNPNMNKRSGRTLVREEIGYLFQNFALVENDTAKQNIELVCKLKKIKVTDPAVAEVLRALSIEDLMNKKVYQLSGGEQQRVALARLFLKEPSILLADEPTASLDPENAGIVLDAISRLNRTGTTVILVTHNPDIRGRADRCITLA